MYNVGAKNVSGLVGQAASKLLLRKPKSGINVIVWNKKTCMQSFSETNLYCMTDGIYSYHTLNKRSLNKACIQDYMDVN